MLLFETLDENISSGTSQHLYGKAYPSSLMNWLSLAASSKSVSVVVAISLF